MKQSPFANQYYEFSFNIPVTYEQWILNLIDLTLILKQTHVFNCLINTCKICTSRGR